MEPAPPRPVEPVDVHLLFPPPWSAFHSVHLSLPLLAGHLKAAGKRAVTSDLNIRVAARLLTADSVRAAAARVEALLAGAAAGGVEASEEAIDRWETALAAAQFVAGEIEGAIARLRDPRDEVERLSCAAQVIRLASMVVSAPDFPGSWDAVAGSYRSRELAGSYALDTALRALRRTDLDTVERALRDALHAAVRAHPARLYGFGIACSEQLFPVLRCAKWIREIEPGAKIVLGGAAVPFLKQTLALCPGFFDLVDFVNVDDGEEPLLQLLRAVEGDVPVSEVPNIRWREGRAVRTSEKTWSAGFEVPACPDFSSVDVGAYFARPTLPFLTGRRCYWNRCTFCSITYDKGTPFGPVPVPALVRQLSQCADETGCRTFTFVDEVVPAPRIRRIAEAILEQGLDVTWDALLRFEEKYEPVTFQRAYQAGFRAAYFGFESGSEKVLDLMQKGYRIPTAERVLREAHDAGVYTHCFVMFGFPGEEEADFQDTLDFCARNGPHIDSVAAGHFSADTCSPCGDNPAAFGLGERTLPPLSLDHRLPQPDREPLMLERLDRFRAETATEHYSFLNMSSLNAGNLLDHLRRHGMRGFRDRQRGLARKVALGRATAQAIPFTSLKFAPRMQIGKPAPGSPDMIPVFDPDSGSLAILPEVVVALAARGAAMFALEKAFADAGAPPGMTHSLAAQGLLVALGPVPAAGRVFGQSSRT